MFIVLVALFPGSVRSDIRPCADAAPSGARDIIHRITINIALLTEREDQDYSFFNKTLASSAYSPLGDPSR
jgi:hypothetical protein